jgi:HTH-type transcriptional regulator / antitoxin HipB
MKLTDKNLISLEDYISDTYGAVNTEVRENFEKDYQAFKLGYLIQEARIKSGLTQEQLALKIGMDKSYISKIENNIKDVRFSTLQKIIEAIGGQLKLSIVIN